MKAEAEGPIEGNSQMTRTSKFYSINDVVTGVRHGSTWEGSTGMIVEVDKKTKSGMNYLVEWWTRTGVDRRWEYKQDVMKKV